jgi:Fic family protein
MFTGGFSGLYKIKTGTYRDDYKGPMQVVSGAVGREKVHYQAPCAKVLKKEMKKLIAYINNKTDGIDLILKSAIVHLWFVSIHPFEDGNGRIARALSDMFLSRSENSSEKFYSMSSQIKKERKAYYKVLEITQKSSLDITSWIQWFLENLILAIDSSHILLKSVLEKADFWKKYKDQPLNERQIKMLNKLLDDFKGNLTTLKWAKMTKASQDTATRDIADLIKKGILVKKGSARSTHYLIQF